MNAENPKLVTFLRLFKKNINKNKKLEPRYFKKLSKIVCGGQICEFLKLFTSFTNNEAIVLGRAIIKHKMDGIEDLVDFLVSKKHKYHIIILTCVLCKGKRISNIQAVSEYVKKFFEEETGMNFYKLILVMTRKYKNVVDVEILEFCRKKEHPVLQEVIREYQK